jgi:hypothetical protein
MNTLLEIYNKINEDYKKKTIILQKEVNPRVTISVTIENGQIKKIKNDFNAPFPFKVGERAIYYQIQNFGFVNGYKIIGEANNNMLKIIKPKGMSLTEVVELVKNKQKNLNEQIVDNSEGNGFIPKSTNKKFNIMLQYKKYPKEKFDVVLEPREYKTEQAFITAVLDDIAIYKLPYLLQMSVLQYFTSNPDQLPPYLKANKGVFKFK